MSEMDALFPLPTGGRNADDMGNPPAGNAAPERHLTGDEQQMLGRALFQSAKVVHRAPAPEIAALTDEQCKQIALKAWPAITNRFDMDERDRALIRAGRASVAPTADKDIAALVAEARDEAEWYSGTESYKDQETARILRQAAAALQSQAAHIAAIGPDNELMRLRAHEAESRAETAEAELDACRRNGAYIISQLCDQCLIKLDTRSAIDAAIARKGK